MEAILHKTDDKVLEALDEFIKEKYPEAMELLEFFVTGLVYAAWTLTGLAAFVCIPAGIILIKKMFRH